MLPLREKFPRCFVRAGRPRCWFFVTDNDPSQASKTTKLTLKDIGAELYQIPACAPLLKSNWECLPCCEKDVRRRGNSSRNSMWVLWGVQEHSDVLFWFCSYWAYRLHNKEHAKVNLSYYFIKECKDKVLSTNEKSIIKAPDKVNVKQF